MDSAITNIEIFIKSLKTRNLTIETRDTLKYLKRYDQLKTNIDKFTNSIAYQTSNPSQILNTISKIERAILSQATTIVNDFETTPYPKSYAAAANHSSQAQLIESQRQQILIQQETISILKAKLQSLERQNSDLHLTVDRLNKLFQ